MLCPTCAEPVDPRTDRCAGGHHFARVDGVLRLLEPAFADRLDRFTAAIAELRHRDHRRMLDPSLYPRLPGARELRRDPAWRTRCYDLALVRRLLRGRGPRRVLDIGAWNGWLAHRLAEDGHDVTAVDYFADPFDGLGARRHHRAPRWRAVQLDLSRLELLDERYDLVVLNRCLQFAADPVAAVAAARARLAGDGRLVATGLEVFSDPTRRAAAAARDRDRWRAAGIEPLVRFKGWLDRADAARLAEAGLELHSYPQLRMWLGRLRAALDPRRGDPRWGLTRW